MEICPPTDYKDCPVGSTGMLYCRTKGKCIRYSTGEICPYCKEGEKWCYDDEGSCYLPIGGYCENKDSPPTTQQPEQPILGGDEDEYGCRPSAGYSYCESLRRCYRSFEEECPQCESGERWCFDDEGSCYLPIGGYCEDKDGPSAPSGYGAEAVESETDELVLCANMRCDGPCADGEDGGVCCSSLEDDCIECGDTEYDNECYAIADGLTDDELDDCEPCFVTYPLCYISITSLFVI